jgi:hypothetical protein
MSPSYKSIVRVGRNSDCPSVKGLILAVNGPPTTTARTRCPVGGEEHARHDELSQHHLTPSRTTYHISRTHPLRRAGIEPASPMSHTRLPNDVAVVWAETSLPIRANSEMADRLLAMKPHTVMGLEPTTSPRGGALTN